MTEVPCIRLWFPDRQPPVKVGLVRTRTDWADATSPGPRALHLLVAVLGVRACCILVAMGDERVFNR
jgi:hypothetical protein